MVNDEVNDEVNDGAMLLQGGPIHGEWWAPMGQPEWCMVKTWHWWCFMTASLDNLQPWRIATQIIGNMPLRGSAGNDDRSRCMASLLFTDKDPAFYHEGWDLKNPHDEALILWCKLRWTEDVGRNMFLVWLLHMFCTWVCSFHRGQRSKAHWDHQARTTWRSKT